MTYATETSQAAVAEKPRTESENYSGLVVKVRGRPVVLRRRQEPDVANIVASQRRIKGPGIVDRVVKKYLGQLARYHARCHVIYHTSR
jgi:hypothetical protein